MRLLLLSSWLPFVHRGGGDAEREEIVRMVKFDDDLVTSEGLLDKAIIRRR